MVGRFIGFFRSLLLSKSPEVQVVANIVVRCSRSTTGSNLMNIERETLLDPWLAPSWRVRAAVPRSSVPAQEEWRIVYLMKLIAARAQMESACENTEEVNALIESLCSS